MEINYLINYIKINKAAEIAFGRAVTTLPYLRNISVIIFGISTQAGWLPNTSGRPSVASKTDYWQNGHSVVKGILCDISILGARRVFMCPTRLILWI